ncbi:MAG: amino acid ABC transporter permease [Pirellulaceae bacterium]|nr:MAG: amino acid ABC transporter permease [Pirellulaceae bacterium]
MSTVEVLQATWQTLLVLFLCLAVTLPTGIFLALLIFRTDAVGRLMALVMVSSQIAVPLYAIAAGWNAGFGIQGWLTGMGWVPLEWFSAAGMTADWQRVAAVGAIHALAGIPWAVLMIGLGSLSTPLSAQWQAACDGGPWHVCRYVLLPQLRPWIALAALWCAVSVTTEMVISNLYQVTTLPELIYLDATRGGLRARTYGTGIVAACGLWLLLLGVRRLFLPDKAPATHRFCWAPGQTIGLGKWRPWWSLAMWLVVLPLIGLPLVSLVIKAGWQPVTHPEGAMHYQWDLHRFVTTLRETCYNFGPEYAWSMQLAGASSLLALGLAVVLHGIVARRWQWLVGALVLGLLAVPGPLVGITITHLLNRAQPAWCGWLYDHTLAAPILAQQFRLLPLAWLGTLVVLSSLGNQGWEQARLDGLSRWQMWSRWILPVAGRRFLAIGILLAVFSIGELSCTILVLPPGVTTLSMRLFEMLHFGMRHQDSGLSGVLVLLGWIAVYALGKTLIGRNAPSS